MIVLLFPPYARLGTIFLNLRPMKTCVQYKSGYFLSFCILNRAHSRIWWMKKIHLFLPAVLKLNSTYNKLREKPMFLVFFIQCMHMYVHVCMCRGKRRTSSVLRCHASVLSWDWVSHRTWSSLFRVGWLWAPGIHLSVSNAEVIIPVAMLNFFLCESKCLCKMLDK